MFARLDHPDAGEANAQALDDLAEGADGLQVVFAGARGAYGFGLGRFDSATLHRVFEGVRFDAGAELRTRSRARGPDQALAFRRLVERSGAEPAGQRGRFRARSVRGLGSRTVPADWR